MLSLRVMILAALALVCLGAGCREPSGAETAPGAAPRTSGNDEFVREATEALTDALRPGSEVGRLRSAVELLEGAPKNASVYANLGIGYWHLKENGKAAKAFRRAAALNRTDPRPLEFLARILMELERWGEAEEILLEAAARAPGSPRILVALAAVEIKSGDDSAAQALLERATAAAPLDAAALYNLGRLYEGRLADPEQAALWFGRYIDALEGAPPVTGSEPLSEGARRERLARALAVVSSVGAARRPPPPATPAPPPPPSPELPKPKPSPADPLLAKAADAVERRAFDEALVLLKQAASKDHENPDALWTLAELYDKHLSYAARAAESYALFQQRFPTDPRNAHAGRRVARLRPADETTTDRDEPDAQALFEQGLRHYRAAEWEKAIALYQGALKMEKDFADAWYNLGFAYKAKGDLQGARAAFEAAARSRPTMIEAQYMLAVVYRKLGKQDEAIELLRIVLKSSPDYAKAHLLLGLALRDSDRSDLAETHLRRYVELAPNGTAAAQIRKWLAATGRGGEN